MTRRRCPQCAERIRAEALICRYCGHEVLQNPVVQRQRFELNRGAIVGVIGTMALVGTVWLSYGVWKDLQANRSRPPPMTNGASEVPASDEGSKLEELSVGATLEWVAETSPDEIQRQAGPYVLTITKSKEDELAAPVVKLTAGSQSVTLKGELSSPGYTNRISLITNRARALPVVMLQSFSGGAHCCNHIQLAGFSQGRLKVVDLGSWDGDDIELPSDISGDGVTDFVLADQSFLYSFSSYASSYPPPQVFNVTEGKAIDVSRKPAFKNLFIETMHRSGEICRRGESGDQRNGACPAYVAAAARVGMIDVAWRNMLSAYDAQSDWDLPTGCRIRTETSCPAGLEIVFKSYPESLLYFLKEQGYVSRRWQPPELSNMRDAQESDSESEYTT